MRRFGLIGRNISYSFSRTYFSEKFRHLKINASYQNFDLHEIAAFPNVLKETPNLEGLNVTIPYKEAIIPYLDQLDPIAADIGAVNTIRVYEDGKLKGFNTDYFGFVESLKPHLKIHHQKALILGTGGASKAVAYGLQSLNIVNKFVSRRPGGHVLSYENLSAEIIREHQVIVNCTPLGTSPRTEEVPAIPVEHLTGNHLIFDLIYNPAETLLMRLAKEKGATTVNGYRMLELQAEKAWEIWNSEAF